MIKFNVFVNIDESKLKEKRKRSLKAAQMMLDQDVLKDSNYYIPKERGDLEDSSIRHSKIGSGKIRWVTKYAKRLYYNPQYNFSHDVNPNARGLWFEVAKKLRKKSWLRKTKQAYAKYFDGK